MDPGKEPGRFVTAAQCHTCRVAGVRLFGSPLFVRSSVEEDERLGCPKPIGGSVWTKRPEVQGSAFKRLCETKWRSGAAQVKNPCAGYLPYANLLPAERRTQPCHGAADRWCVPTMAMICHDPYEGKAKGGEYKMCGPGMKDHHWPKRERQTSCQIGVAEARQEIKGPQAMEGI